MSNTLNISMAELERAVSADPSPSEDFPPEVNERLKTVWTEVPARMRNAKLSNGEAIGRLAHQTLSAPDRKRRILWLRRTADAFASNIESLAACKVGCSHCCHIPLELGEVEAQSIGVAIGRTPVPANQHVGNDFMEFKGVPCTFLGADHRCMIYDVRPIVCHTHLNMDIDDLLCRLLPDAMVPVPYANSLNIRMLAAQVTGPVFSDIRKWFPA